MIGAGLPLNGPEGQLYGFDKSIAADGESVMNQERIFLYGDEGDDDITGADNLSA